MPRRRPLPPHPLPLPLPLPRPRLPPRPGPLPRHLPPSRLLALGRRLDLKVDVSGYGSGKISITLAD
jgi:hypothetical protein